MNNEAYAEWLVKRKAPAYTYATKSVTIFSCVIGAFLALTMVWRILILTAIDVVIFFVFQGTNLESEYLVVNDQLTIDKIMERVCKKKAWEGTMEEVQIVALSDSYTLRDYERIGMETLDFSSHAPGAKTHSPIHQVGTNTARVIFEPNDRVLHRLWMRSLRKVIQ